MSQQERYGFGVGHWKSDYFWKDAVATHLLTLISTLVIPHLCLIPQSAKFMPNSVAC